MIVKMAAWDNTETFNDRNILQDGEDTSTSTAPKMRRSKTDSNVSTVEI